ncbi:Class III cytochrome C family protein [Paucidesulfovibrio gracilis DSM 16080]|uniref:Class III cytochrome C family protein n=1 Tax=Paucidesulfovibrio gracilis DSM 16080 TaxID=1121449 RepID=A0A1T4X207_9BACT|nr:cytochrome c3 family protein [Paucidesulfovibrio gracilis]SKA83612.1 Class III cytochrome C family protein [Paucidesulfovibrio gracilis DSM 16080]
MKRTLFITLLAVALMGAFTLSIAVAADAPAEDVEIKFPGDKMKYAPLMFSHSVHGDLKCEDCHHKMGESDDMKCTNCHSDISRENKRNPDSFDSAWHARKSKHSCVGCHKAMKQGPTKCNDCHTK